jgi:hypothetical protein
MCMAELFCLIKFGKKEHIELLMNQGRMRFAALSVFQNSHEIERGDKFEGAVHIVNGRFSKIECSHPVLGHHVFTSAANSRGTIINYDGSHFCFSSYAITPVCFNHKDVFNIDSRVIHFGESALVITEPTLFLKKIRKRLIELDVKHGNRLVSYYNYDRDGEIETDLFSKADTFSHQSEHRILIRANSNEDAIFVDVGSISEWSFISTTEDLLKTEFKAVRCRDSDI